MSLKNNNICKGFLSIYICKSDEQIILKLVSSSSFADEEDAAATFMMYSYQK
jgi:hypothetical protein